MHARNVAQRPNELPDARERLLLKPLFSFAGGVALFTPLLLVLTAAQVIFAELVPKSLALQYPTQAAMYTLIPMVPSLWIYRPFIKWLNGTGLLILRLLGAPRRSRRCTPRCIRRRPTRSISSRKATAAHTSRTTSKSTTAPARWRSGS